VCPVLQAGVEELCRCVDEERSCKMVDLDLEDIESLRSSVRGMLDRRSGVGMVRGWIEPEPPQIPDNIWRELVEIGASSLLIPPAFGGTGSGFVSAAVLAEELGAHLTPSPYLSSAVLATWALVRSSSTALQDSWLPKLAAGEAQGTVALGSPDGGGRRLDLVIRHDRSGTPICDGVARYVMDGASTDFAVVAAIDDESATPVVAAIPLHRENVSWLPVSVIDRTRSVVHLTFENVRIEQADILAQGQAGRDLLDTLIDAGTVILAADGLGCAKRALNMSVEYAKSRRQFDRPIGSFQAIKHKLADMFVLCAAAEAAVVGAAKALDMATEGGRARISATGIYSRSAASRVTGDAIQVHGGIGFTWEHDCHLLFKRAKFDEIFLTDLWEQDDRLLQAKASGGS
jgi:alkylation response protein AidB-like acyl-CoA dehydrogenase